MQKTNTQTYEARDKVTNLYNLGYQKLMQLGNNTTPQ